VENGGQTPATAPRDTTTATADRGPMSTVSAKPILTASDDKPISTAGEMPIQPSGQMPIPANGKTPTSTADSIDPTGVWWTEVMTVGSEVLPGP
jgi:hypothetical protein